MLKCFDENIAAVRKSFPLPRRECRNDKILMRMFLLLIFSLFLSCGSSVDKTPAVKIIFDTDMGSDCDDVGALALLHAYADEGKAQILACVYSSGKVPYGAGIIDAINTYYGRPDIPIGAYQKDDIGDPVDKMSAEKLAKDTSAFGNDIIHNSDAPDQTRLIRQVLAKQEDGSVTYITVGHTKGVYDLLVSKADDISPLSGTELIRKKILRWIAIGGVSLSDDYFVYDWNYSRNGSAPYTKYAVEHWPVKAVFVTGGEKVFLGKCLKKTPPGNIVRTAYRDWLWWWGHKTLDDQRLSGDLLSVYYAVEGTGEFLTAIEDGYLEISNDGGTKWRRDKNDQNRMFVIQKTGTDSAFAAYLGDMIARSLKRRRE